MRILLVHSYYRLRGGEDVVFEAEAKMLESFGHEVYCYTKNNEDLVGKSRLTNVKNTIWNQTVANEITALIDQHGIEFVHFHNTFPSISPLAIRAAHRAGAVTVQTLHNSRPLCAAGVCYRDHQPCTDCVQSTFGYSAIRHACFHDSRMATGAVVLKNYIHRVRHTYLNFLDVAIAPTHYVRERYQASTVPYCPIAVKPHFLETNLTEGDGSGGYAMFVGRLSEEKGLRTLLDAWPKLKQRLDLKIVGKGPLEGEVRARSSQPTRSDHTANAGNRITYLGQLSQEQVYDAMGNAALLVLPSHCAESFGRVVIEAFAKGTPVVCANQGGQAELVHPGVGGTFISGDAIDLAKVIDSLVGAPDRSLSAMRTDARREYERHYTAEINHEQLQRIYTEATRRRWPDRATVRDERKHHPASLKRIDPMSPSLKSRRNTPQESDVQRDTNDELGRRASTGPETR
ncbi:MAG: glycosyltransferase family 4 protein [Rhodopirellula sp. JB044]|uniref:glycosyltransferase family 4 protein n=1 Tax=Rhodopirellula sp. JB044 TaxID=3342844 RepID=UPI00370A4BF2